MPFPRLSCTILITVASLGAPFPAIAGSILGPGNIEPTTRDGSSPLAFVDLSHPALLVAGMYRAVSFNYEFGPGSPGSVTPFLARWAGSDFKAVAVGSPVPYEGVTAFVSTVFGGAATFILSEDAEVYAGFHSNASGAIHFLSAATGVPSVIFSEVTDVPKVDAPIGPSWGTGIRSYDFSIAVEPVNAFHNFGQQTLNGASVLVDTVFHNHTSGQIDASGSSIQFLPVANPAHLAFTNDGAIVLSGNLTVGGASQINLQNSGSLLIGDGMTFTTDSGVVNTGEIDIQFGGALISTASILNDYGGQITAQGSITQTTGFTNNGQLTLTGQLTANGGQLVNGGQIHVGGNTLLFETGIQNHGDIALRGGSIVSSGSGLLINGHNGIVSGRGTIDAMVSNSGLMEAVGGDLTFARSLTNLAGGELRASARTLSFGANTANNGDIVLNNGLLTGAGAITNTGGTIRGNGEVTNAVHNAGVIRNIGGNLLFSGVGNHNFQGGSIEAVGGSSVIFSQGLSINDGLITVAKDAVFDNNGHAFTNNGSLVLATGMDGFLSGPITNNGSIRSGAGFVNTGTLGNSVDGKIVAPAFNNQGVFNNSGSLNAFQITNSGTFTQSTTGLARGYFTNSGDMSLQGAVYANDLQNFGQLVLDKANVHVARNLLNLDGGNVTASGSITFDPGAVSPNGGVFRNNGALTVADRLNVSGGMPLNNYGTMTVTGVGVALTSDATVVNHGSLLLSRGTLSALSLTNHGALALDRGIINGAVSNSAEMTARGQVNLGAGEFANTGHLTLLGGLTINGGTTRNSGLVDIGGNSLRSNAGFWNEGGTVNLMGGNITVTGGDSIQNSKYGVISGPGSLNAPIENLGRISAVGGTLTISGRLSNDDTLTVDPDSTLRLVSGATNNWYIVNRGGILTGGAVINNEVILGWGRIANQVLNNGRIRSYGGELVFSAAGNTNTENGGIIVGSGATIYSQGLARNDGYIELIGGRFDNNNNGLDNVGVIAGFGTLATGEGARGLTNSGALGFYDGNTTVFGSVWNSGRIEADGHIVTFYGAVTNTGTIKNSGADLQFVGGLTNNGAYISDPADNYFTDLTVTSSGYLVGGLGDRFIVSGSFFNSSTRPDDWDTDLAELLFDGVVPHIFEVMGEDLGATVKGRTNNFGWGTLRLAKGQSLTFVDKGPAGGALYIGELILEGGVSQLSSIFSGGLNLYYDSRLAENSYLNGGTYSFADGGLLMAAKTPEPDTWLMLVAGLGALLAWRRRRN